MALLANATSVSMLCQRFNSVMISKTVSATVPLLNRAPVAFQIRTMATKAPKPYKLKTKSAAKKRWRLRGSGSLKCHPTHLTLKLVIRGPAAATKMSGLTAKLTITSNNNKSYTGDLTFTLTEVLSNETKPAKAQPGSITVPASGEFTNNYNIGEYFDTPRTGAYFLNAIVNGCTSNDLALKMLL